LRQPVEPDLQILPAGARKTAADLVIEPHLVVPPEAALHRRAQHAAAFFPGDPPGRDDADDVVGQTPDDLDHRKPPLI
jgi:hypothetical protein